MHVVSGLDDLVSRYVAEKTGMHTTGPFIGFAVYTEEREFVAGVIVSNYRHIDCEISMAAETANWARKGVMTVIFEYVFRTAGCVRCTCIVKGVKESKRTRRFLEGIGFVLEGNLRRAYDGESSALIYGLLAEDCRFLKPLPGSYNVEEIRSGPAPTARSVRGGIGASGNEQRDGDSEQLSEPDQSVQSVG